MTAYYNEIDPYAAAWLRNLIAAGHIAPGYVDERSIADVRPEDLAGYTQAHFFAGIGGWSLAARLAGWPDDRPLWTGSCPCQPFSAAGKRKGTADERHLWPEFFRLIDAERPDVLVGEQVASKDGLGWLDGVCADLEAADYAVWAADFCAAGVGAPHIRQRLWWLGHALDQPRERNAGSVLRAQAQVDGARVAVDGRLPVGPQHASAGVDPVGRLADANGGIARHGELQPGGQRGQQPAHGCAGAGLGHADDAGSQGYGQSGRLNDAPRREGAERRSGPSSVAGGLADASGERERPDQPRRDSRERLVVARSGARSDGSHNGASGFWSRYDLVPCRDGTSRRVEPGVFPLAHGVSGRVGRLRAYGNAIVPQVAAEILRAYLDGPVLLEDPFA